MSQGGHFPVGGADVIEELQSPHALLKAEVRNGRLALGGHWQLLFGFLLHLQLPQAFQGFHRDFLFCHGRRVLFGRSV